MKKKISFSSILISLIAGAFWGYMMLSKIFLDLNFPYYTILGTAVLAGVFLTLGASVPRFAEILVAGISILLITQASWDFVVWDGSTTRLTILLGSLGILLLDIFIGKITYKSIIKIGKKQLGAK